VHHAAGEVSHDGFRLDVKVAKHLVAAPGRRRKKKPMMIMSAMAWLPGSSVA